jgi:hypothetical protein
LTTRNRGKESSDDKLFADKWLPVFTEAVNDFCYLLSRGYAPNSVLQIVGDRYKLNKRQREAIGRIAASDSDIEQRKAKMCTADFMKGKVVEIDGFNLLILLESAMSGAYIFKGRDGTFRDISSVHGSYKRVSKTEEAILLVGNTLNSMGVERVKWYFDKPVSNSGRLKTMLTELSSDNNFNWEVELVYNPDQALADSKNIVVSSDGWVLDKAEYWYNLAGYLINGYITDANTIVV